MSGSHFSPSVSLSFRSLTSWVRDLCFGLSKHKSGIWMRLPMLGCPVWSEQLRKFCGSRWRVWWRLITRILLIISGRMIFPSGVLHQSVGLSCPCLLYHGVSDSTGSGYVIRISIGPTGTIDIRAICQEARSAARLPLASGELFFFFMSSANSLYEGQDFLFALNIPFPSGENHILLQIIPWTCTVVNP